MMLSEEELQMLINCGEEVPEEVRNEEVNEMITIKDQEVEANVVPVNVSVSQPTTNEEKKNFANRNNHEGYPDPTAFKAINNTEMSEDYKRFREFLYTIFNMCNCADFELKGRIALKDKRTGKIWR